MNDLFCPLGVTQCDHYCAWFTEGRCAVVIMALSLKESTKKEKEKVPPIPPLREKERTNTIIHNRYKEITNDFDKENDQIFSPPVIL